MKAQWVYFPKKETVEIHEVDVPDPRSDEIQVKCIANGICMGEVSLFRDSESKRFPLPRYVGHEGIGVVVKCGKDVDTINEGDYVVCREWATYYNNKASTAVKFSRRPDDPGVMIAEPVDCVVGAIRSYDIMPGDRVLLMGAGYMGLLNVQGLAACPLGELVVTDIKQPNLDRAKEFGATSVLNTGTPEGRARLEQYKEKPFDLVVEAAGVEQTLASAASYCRTGGRLAIFAWHHTPRSVDFGDWHIGGFKVLNSSPMISTDLGVSTMERAVRLMENGTFDQRKLITHRHPLSQVREAMELASERPDGYLKGVLEFEK
ncbi:MAG: zinc-binding dehydrogenase [Chitinivibrionales bacterium]|nr:zinc-binding dehydrogenase [Chitinivibrionales bacterium]